MNAHPRAINLQFGNSATSYQDVIFPPFDAIENLHIMPSSRGSQSEISGT
jgi:hypothetical protein